MYKVYRVVFVLLFYSALAAGWDEVEEECHPLGTSSFHLPTEPVGPGWTTVWENNLSWIDYGFDEYYLNKKGKTRYEFWRWPCDEKLSKLMVTIHPLDEFVEGPLYIAIEQGLDVTYEINLLINSPETLDKMFHVFTPLNYTLTGMVNLITSDINPSEPMTIGFLDHYNLRTTPSLHIPAYDPQAYNDIQPTPEYEIDNSITGQWFNPAQGGHGLMIQYMGRNRIMAQWYTFSPDGSPLWIVADGLSTGDRALLDAYTVSGSGAVFPPYFDSRHVYNEDWGTITLEFDDCRNGILAWDPVSLDLSTGSMPISRLSIPEGISC